MEIGFLMDVTYDQISEKNSNANGGAQCYIDFDLH